MVDTRFGITNSHVACACFIFLFLYLFREIFREKGREEEGLESKFSFNESE